MKELQVLSLGSEKALVANVMNYLTRFGVSNTEDEVVDYINEHAQSSLNDTPAVYVGTYGKYNGGSLYGMWVDMASFDDFDAFIEFCEAIHGDEEDPELMYQDYEGFPYAWYSESGIDEDTFDKIKEFAESENQEAAEIWLSDLGHDSLDGFEDAYQGEWDSEEDFAWHIYEECYEFDMTEFAKRYFDIDAFARDLFICDYTFEGGHVFSCC